MKKLTLAILIVLMLCGISYAVPITDTNNNGILSDGNFALRTTTVSSSNVTEGQITLAAGTLQQIIAANVNRTSFTVQNHGANAVYCGTNAAITAANGPILLPQYGSYVFDRTKSAISCISTGGSTVGYIEQY